MLAKAAALRHTEAIFGSDFRRAFHDQQTPTPVAHAALKPKQHSAISPRQRSLIQFRKKLSSRAGKATFARTQILQSSALPDAVSRCVLTFKRSWLCQTPNMQKPCRQTRMSEISTARRYAYSTIQAWTGNSGRSTSGGPPCQYDLRHLPPE